MYGDFVTGVLSAATSKSSFTESNSQRLNKIIQSKEREKHKNNKYTGKKQL